ncbi:hypothetical protein 13VV501A_gene0027 [Vibrio phage 13VV501A]|nr:hypothetical protein 13VV501A_gene0027 [Vibrio phage 13VV501A]
MARIKLVDKSATYYATRRFTMDGVEYQQDQEVPVGKLDDRSAVRLIKSTYVTDRTPAAAPAVNAQEVKAVTPVITDPTPPKNPHALYGSLTHMGGGQWEVQDESGVNMLPDRIKGKDMAKMAAEQFGITIVE